MVDLRDQFPAADHEAGLRPAEQLVARESDEVGAVGHGFRHRRFVRETEARQIDQRAGTEIVNERNVMLLRQRGEFARRHLLGEAFDAVVGGVNLQNEPGLRANGCGVILLVCAVGGADLDQPGPCPRHDLRQAERAADLDQFAAGDDRLAAPGERIEHQQHGGRIIVDDGRILGPGQFAQDAAQMVVALATAA